MSKRNKDLIAAAKKVREKAHAPYSKFKVGAAILSASGKIYTGCNMENASYGLTVCAERNAVAQMVAAGEKTLVSLAVVTDRPKPASPCGACRQVISEFSPNAEIVMSNLKGIILIENLLHLLPSRFRKESFKCARPV